MPILRITFECDRNYGGYGGASARELRLNDDNDGADQGGIRGRERIEMGCKRVEKMESVDDKK